MQEKLLYGAHQVIHILPYTVDRTNLFTGRVEYQIGEDFDKPDPAKMSLTFGRTVSAMAGIGSMAVGSGSNPTPSCVGVERRYDTENSMAIYTYTFEGIAVNHGEKFIEFELEFTMNQQPIETHPNFEALNEIYGHYDAINRIWPQFITEQAAAVGLQSQRRQAGAVLNPLFGVSSYLEPGLIYRISFTDTDVDQDFLMDIGTIAIPPKFGDAFPELQTWITSATPNRNWLKLAPKIHQRGSCIQIVEEFMLSGYRGWLPDVYSAGALGGTQL
jgi:hypothetical protein